MSKSLPGMPRICSGIPPYLRGDLSGVRRSRSLERDTPVLAGVLGVLKTGSHGVEYPRTYGANSTVPAVLRSSTGIPPHLRGQLSG